MMSDSFSFFRDLERFFDPFRITYSVLGLWWFDRAISLLIFTRLRVRVLETFLLVVVLVVLC
jgi:hypothetical protein